jgi:mRNA interferase RelE/StbE
VTEPHGRYVVEWAGPALRALARVPERVGSAVIEFVYGPLADNPRRVGHPLRFELEGHNSASRGDYRVVYLIDDDRRIVVIEAIAHRADVYRRRRR